MSKPKLDSSTSSDKFRSVAIVESPFIQNSEGQVVVDATKLIKVWAANAEAMQAVGTGFENVVAACNTLIKDNDLTRDTSKQTRTIVFYGLLLHLIMSVSLLYAVFQILQVQAHAP